MPLPYFGKKVSAQIEDVKWSTGNITVRSGGNSTRRPKMGYETIGIYQYDFEGKTYQSDKLVLIPGKSTYRTKERKVYDTLKFHKRKDMPMTAYVNPRDPSQAILFRRYNWMMALMMFFFSGIAFLVAFAGISVLRDDD